EEDRLTDTAGSGASATSPGAASSGNWGSKLPFPSASMNKKPCTSTSPGGMVVGGTVVSVVASVSSAGTVVSGVVVVVSAGRVVAGSSGTEVVVVEAGSSGSSSRFTAAVMSAKKRSMSASTSCSTSGRAAGTGSTELRAASWARSKAS